MGAKKSLWSIYTGILLFLIFFAYRFAFRDELEVMEMLQIFMNSGSDLIMSYALFGVIQILPKRVKFINSHFLRRSLIVLIVVLTYILCIWILKRMHYFNFSITTGFTETLLRIFNNHGFQIFNSYLVLAFGVMFLSGSDNYNRWERSRRRILELEHERQSAELTFLKAQINPHFIFNALNNIHFLVEEKNEKARKLVKDFSDLLRYQLYDTSTDFVPLKKEVDYIKKYIEVQKIRKEEKFEVQFEHSKLGSWTIAPMLFIVLVENAFKYSSSGEHGRVNIELKIDEGLLWFLVENDIDPKVNAVPQGGLGIENLKKRLKLIYGDEAALSQEESSKMYKSVLKINLRANEKA